MTGRRVAWVRLYRQKTDGTLAVLIPKDIQVRLKLLAGEQLVVYEDDGRIMLERVPTPHSRAKTTII